MSETCRLGVSLAALDQIFRALVECGCEPCWTAGGRAIVSDCPSCGGRRALLVQTDSDDEVHA